MAPSLAPCSPRPPLNPWLHTCPLRGTWSPRRKHALFQIRIKACKEGTEAFESGTGNANFRQSPEGSSEIGKAGETSHHVCVPFFRRNSIIHVSRRNLLLKSSFLTTSCVACLISADATRTAASAAVVSGNQNGLNPQSTLQQQFFAYVMAHGMESYERNLEAFKEELFTLVSKCIEEKGTPSSSSSEKCDIVELGIGTAPNLKFYAPSLPSSSLANPSIRVIGVDPNPAMEVYARASAESAGLSLSQFTFIQGLGEFMPLESETADIIIASLVLCSVKDVEKTITEIQRVLKRGGKYLFLEHVAAEEDSTTKFFQHLLNPLQQALADGCHLDRNPLPIIQQVFQSSNVQFQKVSITGLGLLSTHLIGYATKIDAY